MTTETVTVEAGEVGTVNDVVTTERAPTVTQEEFIRALKVSAASGHTIKQAAESLGMKPASYNQRLNQLRNAYKLAIKNGAKLAPLPLLKDGRTGRVGGGKGKSLENAILAELRAISEDSGSAPEVPEVPAETSAA